MRRISERQPGVLFPTVGIRSCHPRIASFLAAIIVALFSIAPGLFAQQTATFATPAPEPLSSNRFLFVVDTSAFMRRHLSDVLDVVETILRSSASGQLHDGDTIGVWTFNDDLFTGNMPLQVWKAEDSEEITLRIAEFLRQQDYGKKSRLDEAVSAVDKVVSMSDILTVVIVSSGQGPISGTPFDDQINSQYLACLHDMGRKPMPIVTVLQGKNGKIIRYTVNALPWPVVIPEVPIPLKVLHKPAVAPIESQITATKPVVPPVAVNTPAPPVQPPVVQSPPTVPATQPPVTAESTPAPQIPPGVSSIPPPPAVLMNSHPMPPITATETPPTVSTPTPTQAPPVTANEPPPPRVAPSTVAPTPAATGGDLPLVPPRQPPVVQKMLPATDTMAQAPAAAPTTPQATVAPTAPAPAPAPAKPLITQATALIKSFTGGHRSLLLVGGLSLLLLAAGLTVLLARRSRPSGRVSLITQTMNDQRR